VAVIELENALFSRTQALKPEVENLLIQPHADERSQFNIHLYIKLVMGLVYVVNTSIEKLVRTQNLLIFIQPECLTKDKPGEHRVVVSAHFFSYSLLNEYPRMNGSA